MRHWIIRFVMVCFVAATVLSRVGGSSASASDMLPDFHNVDGGVELLLGQEIEAVKTHDDECACGESKSKQSFFACGIAIGLPSQTPSVQSRFAERTRSLSFDDQASSLFPDPLKRPPRSV